MKKLFIGFIAGALFMTAGSALAETVIKNLVGRTIEGQFPVRVDGAYIQNPAIVTDGTSFLPVKEFATTVGYAVYFDPEGEILLERIIDVEAAKLSSLEKTEKARIEQEQINAAAAAENANNKKIGDLERAIRIKTKEIEQAQERVQENEEKMRLSKQTYKENSPSTVYETTLIYQKYMDLINTDKKLVNQLQSELTELEAQKAQLQAK